MHPRNKRATGFSLIEVIVILIIAGILGALMVSMMSSQLTKSSQPLVTAQNAASAETCMENVVAYFTTRVNTNLTTALADVRTQYQGNSTVSCVDGTYSGVPVLIVTVTVNDSSLTTVLAQMRTNTNDSNATY